MTITPTQIMPAYNWFAVFQGKDEKQEEVFIHIPLVCWALTTVTEENGNSTSVIHGMIPDDSGNVLPAKSAPSFLGYELESDDFEVEDDGNNTGGLN